jgi:hypothetical protein
MQIREEFYGEVIGKMNAIECTPGRWLRYHRPHTPRMQVRSHKEALTESPFRVVDDRAWLVSLKSWLTEQEWRFLMVLNPEALYGW